MATITTATVSSKPTKSSRALKRLSLLQSPASPSSDKPLQWSDVLDLAGPSKTATAEHVANLKNARRRSTVIYFPPNHESPLRDVDNNNHCIQAHTPSSPAEISFKEAKHARRKSTIGYFPPNHEPELRELGSRERDTAIDREDVGEDLREMDSPGRDKTPLTLAEKHEDLLRFIAQKESRCLELRSQLATEEAELVVLKRKWERIVSRGFNTVARSDTPKENNTTPTKARGLRHLKTGSTEMGVQTDIDTSSTASSSFTSSSSNRLSQSSVSSVGGQEEIINAQPMKKAAPLVPTRHFSSASTSTRPSTTRASRRRTYDFSSVSLTPIKTSPPSPLSSPPSPPNSKSSSTSQPMPSWPASPKTPRHQKRSSIASVTSGAFPMPASIPGLSMLTAAAGGAVSVTPLSSWVDTVGKKIGRDVQRRASTLISDASSTLLAALSSPSPKHPSEISSWDISTASSPSRTPSSLASSSLSLLDDDEDVEGLGETRGKILEPVIISPGGLKSTIHEDPEEWNW